MILPVDAAASGETGTIFQIETCGQLIFHVFNADLEVSYAHRRVSRDGALLNVLQFDKRPDGTRALRLQTNRCAPG